MNGLFQRYLNTFRGLSRDVWLLALVMLVNRAGAMVLPFLTIYLTKSRGFSLAEAGMVMSFFGLGSLGGNFIGGWLTDKWRYLRVQVLSLWLAGGMWLVLWQADTLVEVCLAVFFTSLFADLLRPANMTAVELHGVPENRTRALSLIRLAINLGFSIGPAAAGFLIASGGYDSLFVIDAITCWLASLVLIFGLKEKKKGEILPPSPSEKDVPAQPVVAALSPYRDRRFLIFALSQMLVAMAFMQVFSTIPVYWEQVLHLNERGIGLLMAANGLIIVILEMPLIHYLEHKKTPIYWIQAGGLLIGAGYAVLILGDAMIFSLIYVILITFGEIFNFPFGSSYALSIANPSYRGRYMGLYAMLWSVSFIIAPSSGSYIADHFGYQVLAGVMTLLTLLGCAGLYATTRWQARAKLAAGL